MKKTLSIQQRCSKSKRLLFEIAGEDITYHHPHGVCSICNDLFAAELLTPYSTEMEIRGATCDDCLDMEDENVTATLALEPQHPVP